MIADEELDRIVAVDHPEPHRVLGPHVEDGGLVVRAFRPGALEVLLRPEGAPAMPMRRIRGLGLFEVTLPGFEVPPPYTLEVRYPQSTVTERDAYAFPASLGDLDLHLAAEGTHLRIYERLGAHVKEVNGVPGTAFAVWAPSAQRVSVSGSFNGWDGRSHAMRRMGHGIWEIFVPDVGDGALYKFEVKTMHGLLSLKADPYGRAMELRPRTASKVTVSRFTFTDEAWIAARAASNPLVRPMSIYEVHLGSWRRRPAKSDAVAMPDPADRWLSYRELADVLIDYVAGLGFTHLELLPVMEHPYDGSWGYQVAGYFAPTSRYGTPDDFRYFVDRCHARGLAVILDWTPAHFPKDAFALGRFDGSALYEHLDPRQGEHRQWQTYVFNYGRPEVKNFLISNALYWIEEFHVDGLRVDAVASMLELDYAATEASEWVPNKFGGKENLEAVAFVRDLCDAVHGKHPGVVLAAEESTTWPGVTRPTYLGGLGFDLKWNMGWMHDTLDYFALDPILRASHHGKVTFGLMYAFTERFILPLSHDEVVHLKKSLLSKMHGDRWKMHATLRALYGYMWAHPGRKLLFMGGEIGQWGEWNFEGELDWSLLDEADHRGLSRLVGDLNGLYVKSPSLFEVDDKQEGFRWIDANDAAQSVASFVRFPKRERPRGGALTPLTKNPRKAEERRAPKGSHVVCVGNFTPVPRFGYRVGVPRRCAYREVLNTDATIYGGTGMGNYGVVAIERVPSQGYAQSIVLTLPPLAVLWLVPELDEDPPFEVDDVEGELEEDAADATPAVLSSPQAG